MSLKSNPNAIETMILPKTHDLGGFEVRRALPSAKRRMVGPFIFLDGLGPSVFGAGDGVDTRPHPHIGLSTLTYLIEGEMDHRDSEGFVQTIRPGEVNLMTAGRGIVHSERSSPEFRKNETRLFGFQSWLALPLELEETEPGFQHVPAADIPVLEDNGASLRLIAGTFGGATSPTRIFSETLYADVVLDAAARLKVENNHVERAIYVAEGHVSIEGQDGAFEKDHLIVFKPGSEIVLRAHGRARLMLLGGEPLEGKRHIFWNFVSSREDRIAQAAEDWRNGQFPVVPGDPEFIPLPTSYSPRRS